MRIIQKVVLLFALVGCLNAAAVPAIITFQGRLYENNTPVTAIKNMRFEIVTPGGTVWTSNDTLATPVAVNKGVYSVRLGDTALSNMTALPVDGFNQSTVLSLRVFVDGTALSPDIVLDSAPYALVAGLAATANSAHVAELALKAPGTLDHVTGIIIPMYIYPGSIYTNADYNQLIDLKKKYHSVPVYVILNPASGPGTVQDGNYSVAIQRLQGAGIKVLGYIDTAYAGRSLAAAEADVDQWKNLYPGIDGIFYDQMTNDGNAAHIAYFKDLTTYIHLKGFYPSIGNPGTTTIGDYFDNDCADIIMTWENSVYPSESDLKGDFSGGNASYDYSRRAGIVYSQGAFNLNNFNLMRTYLGLVYINSGSNSWSSVSGYMETMLQKLSAADYALTANYANDSEMLDGFHASDFATSANYLPSGTAGQTIRHNASGWESTSALFVSANGNVGVGTAYPSAKLDVENGDVFVMNNANNPRLVLGDTTAAGEYGFLQWDSTNNYFRIEKNGANGMKINDNNVAIGNIYPSEPLIVGSGSTELMRVSGGGNVGIGSNNPSGKLHVASTGDTRIDLESTNATAPRKYLMQVLGSVDGRFRIYDATASAERFYITAVGNAVFTGTVTAPTFNGVISTANYANNTGLLGGKTEVNLSVGTANYAVTATTATNATQLGGKTEGQLSVSTANNANLLDGVDSTAFALAAHTQAGSTITSTVNAASTANYAVTATTATNATQLGGKTEGQLSVSTANNANLLDGVDSTAFALAAHTQAGSTITSTVNAASTANYAVTATTATNATQLGGKTEGQLSVSTANNANLLDGVDSTAFALAAHTQAGSTITSTVNAASTANYAVIATTANSALNIYIPTYSAGGQVGFYTQLISANSVIEFVY
jgi:hypothetical protein